MTQIVQAQSTLQFSGDLQLSNIYGLLQQVLALTLPNPLTLDFSAVNKVDTSAISLVLELQRQLHAKHADHARLQLTGVPDNLRSLMQLYGVESFLM